MINGWGISYEIALRCMPLQFIDDKSTLVQLMAWYPKGNLMGIMASQISGNLMVYSAIIPYAQLNWRWIYWFHLVRLSVRRSVRLWTESCPLCIFHNTCWTHFIFAHLIKQLQKVCCMKSYFKIQKILSFGNLTLSGLDLGFNMNQ